MMVWWVGFAWVKKAGLVGEIGTGNLFCFDLSEQAVSGQSSRSCDTSLLGMSDGASLVFWSFLSSSIIQRCI